MKHFSRSLSGNTLWALIFSRKMLILLMMGFSSGLPIALVHGSLQAWYKSAGVDIVTIGFLALVGQPYSYKFIWAPLMDRFIPPLLGRRRGWIAVTQVGLIITLLVMTHFDPQTSPVLLGGVGLILAFLSASQDIAIDAYRTDILTAEERGLGAAIFVSGYRLALLVSGGLALFLAYYIGWVLTYQLMALLMLANLVVTFIAPNQEDEPAPPKHLMQACVESFREFLSRPFAWQFLALIVLYKLGDAFSATLSSAFLLDLGFNLKDVGVINKTMGLVATVVGGLLGGTLLASLGLFRSLLIFGVLQCVSNLLYMILATAGPVYWLASFVFFVEHFCGGMGTTAFFALLMTLCNHQYTATQFALLSSLSAIGRVYVGPVAGVLVSSFGWAIFYFSTALFALPGLLLLVTMKKPIQNLESSADKDDTVEAPVNLLLKPKTTN